MRATWVPYGEHARAPTIATAGNASSAPSPLPRRWSLAGGSWIARSSGGSSRRRKYVTTSRARWVRDTRGPRQRARAERRLRRRARRSCARRRRPSRGRGRIANTAGGTRDDELAVLERLAQCFERGTLELRELIQQQDAAMREAGFARPQSRPAADDRGRRRAVMRRAKRRVPDQRMVRVD